MKSIQVGDLVRISCSMWQEDRALPSVGIVTYIHDAHFGPTIARIGVLSGGITEEWWLRELEIINESR